MLFSGGNHKVCGEEGSYPWTQLALLHHRVSEVLPHHNVRLHHEGTVNNWDTGEHRSHRHRVWYEIEISDLSIKEGVEMVTLPADIGLLLNGPSANVSSASYSCYLGVRWVCEWLPFIQRVVTVIHKSIYGNGTSFITPLLLHISTLYTPVQCVSPLQCCNCNVWWCSLLR